MSNIFHDHLDVCEQCREHPFNLCAEGARLLPIATEQAQAELEALRAEQSTVLTSTPFEGEPPPAWEKS